jgi:hypothetical protein
MVACGGLGSALSRSAYTTEWARMMVYLQGMQGMGKPGIGMWTTNQGAPFNADFYFPGYAEGGISGDSANTAATYQLVSRGMHKAPVTSMVNNPLGQHIPRLRIPEAIMNLPSPGEVKVSAATPLKCNSNSINIPKMVSPDAIYVLEIRRRLYRHYVQYQPLC